MIIIPGSGGLYPFTTSSSGTPHSQESPPATSQSSFFSKVASGDPGAASGVASASAISSSSAAQLQMQSMYSRVAAGVTPYESWLSAAGAGAAAGHIKSEVNPLQTAMVNEAAATPGHAMQAAHSRTPPATILIDSTA